MKYETIIGIETHVQLKTKTKLFCGCDNDAREAEPNTTVCPVCMGFPGALPVLSEQAIKLGLKAALALNGEVPKQTKFDRKNYFYPDLPNGYQITQFDQPIVGKGQVEFPLDGRTVKVGITRAHLEADAGKLTHPTGADYSLVDLNRSGTPLLEIVSEPDMRTAAEAKAYAQEIYNLMRYASVSDANLYYGNMRFDVNVSLRPVGAKEFGTRTETKNLNSFRAVEKAVDYEAKRQAEVLEHGDQVVQETRGWDDVKQKTFSQRSKEEAHDYRYFPEPDLPPVVITAVMKAEAKDSMPMLPNQIRAELTSMTLTAEEAEILVNSIEATQLVLEWKSKVKPAQFLAGTRAIVQDSELRENFASLNESQMKDFTTLSGVVSEGVISKTAFAAGIKEAVLGKKDVEVFLKPQVSDTGEIDKFVDEAIKAHPEAVADYKAGKQQALGALVGAIMKASRGQANPSLVNELLLKKLKES